MTYTKKTLYRIFSFILVFQLILSSSVCFARQTKPIETKLILAKALHFYSMGKLDDALTQIETVLIRDPQNPLAREYLSKIFSRIYETQECRNSQKPERLGKISSEIAQSRIDIGVEKPYIYIPGNEIYERFINTFSTGYRRQQAEASSDTDFDPSGYFIEEHFRYDDDTVPGYQSTFIGDIRYHDNDHEDGRMRRGTYALSNQDMRFIVGDTATRFSRYVMRGIYYRGLSLYTKSDKDALRFVGGAVPTYLTDTEEWIHPRSIYGLRGERRFSDRYSAGISMMHLIDSNRVRTINSAYNPKNNYVISFDEAIEVIPDMWRIKTETAYSYSDEDRTDEDIIIKEETLSDYAHYFRSQIRMPKFNLVNLYERIEPDFRSYADISSSTTWYADLTGDREHIYNFLEYYPLDSIYTSLFFSRTRNNLDSDSDVETNERMFYGHELRLIPPPEARWPRFSIRTHFENARSNPGSVSTSDDVSDRDIIFELCKRLYGIDLTTSYTNRKRIENIKTYATYSDVYSVSAAKELSERVLLNLAYLYDHSDEKQDGRYSTSAIEEDFNINTSMRLWDTSNLTLGYAFERDKDFVDAQTEAKRNSLFTTFGWPFSRTYRWDRKLTLNPFISYHLATDDNSTRDRSVWTANLDSSYSPTEDQKISMEVLYRQDQDDDQNGESKTDEYRLLLTYRALLY